MVKVKRWGKKRKYERDWKAYNEQLIKRGEYYINPVFLETWIPEVNKMNVRKVGEPYFYPDSMIRFLAVLYGKGFEYRALQGIMRGLSRHFYDFPVISFSQIRRRMLELPLSFNAEADDLVVGIDGSGMKVSNRGEWIRQAWGIRRGWIKVVIMGDSEGNIVDIRVGNEDMDERKSGRGMLRKNGKNVKKAMMDGLHDCKDTFNLCKKLEIEPAIKIRDNASEKGLSPRANEVRKYKRKGYKRWAKEKEYGKRWVCTEGIFSAVKRIFGENVRSHKIRNSYKEARIKFWAYQQLKNIR